METYLDSRPVCQTTFELQHCTADLVADRGVTLMVNDLFATSEETMTLTSSCGAGCSMNILTSSEHGATRSCRGDDLATATEHFGMSLSRI